ncbi:kinesin, putative [Trypanosoma cruzi]|uniref:Kinesin, putative n=2 Tax=Trypanosoma cruzi TaxID=5693 RepID=Q4E671_TRYCC|nr:kinesin, putative [Trypanosoma cruzi]EAO00199.1 kinesin, putative [Trypanosoma cruzi]|eukprot:XP_822050.1 kinesin [Trypanosoma cruzi strain CL Brener]
MGEASKAASRIQVGVRMCPPRQGEKVIVHADSDDQRAVLIDAEGGRASTMFKFDRVFTGGQDEVYETIGRPMLKEAFEGFNVCLFAYGQTGSGKTHSLFGDLNSKEGYGVAPRFAQDMIEEAQLRVESDSAATIKFFVTMIEVYMEKVRDLLAPRARGQEPESLEIHEDSQHRVYVKGAGVHSVLSLERMLELLKKGNANRQTGETKMNETSSRSHAIVQITISQKYGSLDMRDVESVVLLVDLAGSERQSKTESTGVAFEEAKKINQSLLMLGRAMNSFSDRKGGDAFISLRASKLTRLLSESFGGNSKTWMLATVSTAANNLTETISTLEYAQNAMAITNKAKVNKTAKDLEYDEIQKLAWVLQIRLDDEAKGISALDAQIQGLRGEIDCMKSKLTVASDSKVETELKEALEDREELLLSLRKGLIEQRKISGFSAALVCFSGTCKTSLANIPFGSYEVTTLVVPCYMLAGPPPFLICHIHVYLTEESSVAVLLRLRELQHLPDYATGGVQVTVWFEGHYSSAVQTPIVRPNGGNPQFSLRQMYLFGPHTEDLERFFQLDVLNFRVEGIMSDLTS